VAAEIAAAEQRGFERARLMLIVSVRLLSAVTGVETELARMHICNDGTGSATIGNYECTSLRGRSVTQLDRRNPQRLARVKRYRRLDLHVWNLVALALQAMGYGAAHESEERRP
jgi:hypothetical protein